MSDHLISALQPGTRLAGRYRIEQHLGDGAAASVYRAFDDVLEEVVALKVLDPLREPDPVGRSRFEREFQVLCAVSHPGIARCLRLERDGELDLMVLEHLEGETLGARLERGRMPIDEAVAIALRIAQALEACHQAGVLHRDLKPDNIMLHPERGPIILDFGVAWFGAAATLTRTGAMIGTPQYMAPEAFSSTLSDARADVYAVGAMLFEMLAGRPVQLGDGIGVLALAHEREPAPAVSTLRPEVGRELDAIVARAIALRPEERLATAGELCCALEQKRLTDAAAIRTRTRCSACDLPLIVDLPFCSACGLGVSWALSKGPYAVQIALVPDRARCVAWLSDRHAGALAAAPALIGHRLEHTPVPLAIGVSLSSAEQLVAEASDAGCRAELVRARAVLGARIKASAASNGEVLTAAGLHLVAVTAFALLLRAFWVSPALVGFLPTAVALLGAVVAYAYIRRPLLRLRGESQGETRVDMHGEVRAALAALRTPRARQLAASAVSRAAPLLRLDSDEGLATGARQDATDELRRALGAARDVDVHAELLAARSRSRLAVDLERARGRAERGEPNAGDEVLALEREKGELLEASLAHDLAARIALEATRGITAALTRPV